MSGTRTHRGGLRHTVVHAAAVAPGPSPRRRTGRRVAALLTLALAAASVSASPASAVDDSLGQYALDEDPVALRGVLLDAQFGDGLFVGTFPNPGSLKWYRSSATGRIRGQLVGKLGGTGGAASCRLIEATWTYGDGSQSVSPSSQSCGPLTTTVDLDSAPNRDALKVTIDLYRIEPFLPHDNRDLVASRLEQVSEPDDGNGTCARIDRDTLTMTNAAGAVFIGSVTYSCDASGGNELSARVTGTLVWRPTSISTRSRLSIRWDTTGGTTTVQSGVVSAFTTARPISFTSPADADVRRVRASVLTAPLSSTGTFTVQASQTSDLGRA